MTSSANLAKKNPPNVSVIGPFLGIPDSQTIRITIGLPHFPANALITCHLTDASGQKSSKTCPVSSDLFQVASFDFSNLLERSLYHYSFQHQEKDLDLEGQLKKEDLRFVSPGGLKESDSAILMSCHNPFMEKRGSADHGWAMWEHLAARIEKDDSIRFLLLGGDQLYNDDVEDEFLAKMKGHETEPEMLQQLTKRFIRNYQLFWENLHYRRVLARIPSYAMWDDHDITDGWGGREESFGPQREFLPHWKAYFNAAKAAYQAYQGIRNPSPIPGAPKDVFTYAFDFGSTRFLIFDFRSKRGQFLVLTTIG